jgi:putative ABC transport system permease protein
VSRPEAGSQGTRRRREARSDDGACVTVEPWSSRILLRALPPSEREFVAGDLAEALHDKVERDGVRAARRWHRRHAALTVLSWWARRIDERQAAWRRDTRHAVRALHRSPGYTTTVLLTFTVGFGGAAAIGSLVESTLRPLPFPRPDRLVSVWETRDGARRSVAPANYLDWRRRARAFDGLAAYDARGASVTVDGIATRARVAMVSGNFFDVLGITASLGRTFDPQLDPAFPERLVVLSQAAWRDSFGASREAIGRSIRVDELAYRVVGVAPPGLRLPEAGLFGWLRSRTEAPELAGVPGTLTEMRDAWYFRVVGRLGPGATLATARTEMSTITDRLAAEYPETNRRSGAEIVPLRSETVAGSGATLLALGLAVLLVLFAATVNVALLGMARAEARAMDASIRRALGAGRADVRRVTLAEVWVLALVGTAAGVAVAGWALSQARALFASLPRPEEIVLRPPVAAMTLLVALGSGTVIAWLAGRRSAAEASPGHVRGGDRQRGAIARGMIATQVATAIALMAGTTTMARSLAAMAAVDLGFDDEGLTTVYVALPDARARPYEERVAKLEEVRDDLLSLSAVASVGLSATSPLEAGPRAGVRIVGELDDTEPPVSGWQPIDPEYFGVMRMRMLRGRGFGPADAAGTRDVAVVNEAFERTVLGGTSALDREVTMGLDGHDRPLTIVGVLANTRTAGPASEPEAVLYRPLRQTTRFGASAMLVAIRSAGPDPVPVADVRALLRERHPGLPVFREAIGTDLARPFRDRQLTLAAVLAVFAFTAVGLVMIGVYGVTAYSVRRRGREIAVRLALGADQGRVTAEVLGDGLRTALPGLPVGVGLALLLGQILEGLVFGVSPGDVGTLASASVLVLVTVAAALWAPGRAAARTDPAETMRKA